MYENAFFEAFLKFEAPIAISEFLKRPKMGFSTEKHRILSPV